MKKTTNKKSHQALLRHLKEVSYWNSIKEKIQFDLN
jgi:hypothetical protein